MGGIKRKKREGHTGTEQDVQVAESLNKDDLEAGRLKCLGEDNQTPCILNKNYLFVEPQ